jgi:hypothetical protein
MSDDMSTSGTPADIEGGVLGTVVARSGDSE